MHSRLLLNTCALLLLLALTACGAVRALPQQGTPPGITVLLFHNGLHTGLVVPVDDDWRKLDPQTKGEAATYPYLEIGFAADAWIGAQGPGCGTSTRLALWGSPGVLVCEHQPTLAVQPREDGVPVRSWILQLDPLAWQRLKDCVKASIDQDAAFFYRRPEQKKFICIANSRWSVTHNCHDFTADMLAACGLQLDSRTWRTSDGMAEQLDEAVKAMATAGITIMRPLPQDKP